jgi:integrase
MVYQKFSKVGPAEVLPLDNYNKSNAINFRTRHIIMRDGERFKIIVNADTGVPLYYPTLYATSQIRNRSQSVLSIQSIITAIKCLMGWMEHHSIEIEKRFRQGELLNLREIESLRDFFKLPIKTEMLKKSHPITLKRTKEGARMAVTRKGAGVNPNTEYIRITYAANYLRWLAEILNRNRHDKAYKLDILSMEKRIKAHRPIRKSRLRKDRDEKGLDPTLIDDLMKAIRPGSGKNPFRNTDVQIRNALIISLLRFLGIRRGELLNLQVMDINCISNEVRIRRRPDSMDDTRTSQPLVKTLERIIPINDGLAERLNDYVRNIRSQFPQAISHPYFFVTHRAGPYQGRPLSNSGFGKIMAQLQRIDSKFADVHAHALRHSWNYSFSVLIDKSSDRISPEREEQMRSYLMGWADGSGTAATYNRRHVKEKARKAVLEYQDGMINEELFHKERKHTVNDKKRKCQSKDCYSFCLDDPIWKLNREINVNVAWTKNLDRKIQKSYLNVLAYYGENYPADHTKTINDQFKHYIDETGCDSIQINSLIFYLSSFGKDREHNLGILSTFICTWHEMGYPGVNKEVVEFFNRLD